MEMDDGGDVSIDDILRYQNFITCTLEPELRAVEGQCDLLEATAGSCQEFCKLITNHLKSEKKNAPLTALVEIGERCIFEADVPDASRFIVDLGLLDIRVEMPSKDAVDFVRKRGELLTQKLAVKRRKSEAVAADIHEATELLGHLKSLRLDTRG